MLLSLFSWFCQLPWVSYSVKGWTEALFINLIKKGLVPTVMNATRQLPHPSCNLFLAHREPQLSYHCSTGISSHLLSCCFPHAQNGVKHKHFLVRYANGGRERIGSSALKLGKVCEANFALSKAENEPAIPINKDFGDCLFLFN